MANWELKSLAELISIKHGYAFKGEYFKNSGKYIVLTPGNFNEEGGFRRRKEKDKYYSGDFPVGYILTMGDLIVAMTEQGEGLLGSTAIVPENDKFLHNQRLGLISSNQGISLDLKYIYYVFNSNVVRQQIRATASGAKVRHTSPFRIGEVKINLPPFYLQHRIASILSAYDDLIENNTRRIAILEEMARRIYEEWFVHFRFPGHENVRMVESELGLIPEGWAIRSFDNIASFVNGYAFKPDDWGTEGIPIIKIKELKAGIQTDTPRYAGTLTEKYRVKNGTLLFSWSADLDVYIWAEGEGWLNQHLFLVTAKEASIPPSFLFHALSTSMPLFRSRSNGATMKHIKRSALSEVKTVFPTEYILVTFAETVQPIHDLIIRLNRKNRNLRTTRDLLLPKLISGELDVSQRPEPDKIAE